MTTTTDLARRARAHGFDVTSADPEEPSVTIEGVAGHGLTPEVVLFLNEDGTVYVTIVYNHWTYDAGYDADEYDVGSYAPAEALRYVAWLAKVEERRNAEVVRATEEMDRAQAEYEAREQREADEEVTGPARPFVTPAIDGATAHGSDPQREVLRITVPEPEHSTIRPA